MIDMLKQLAIGESWGQMSSNPDYIRAEAKWHGLVLTLSPQACSNLANGMGIGAAISAALAFIPTVGPALAFVVVAGITASAQIINLANRGQGVWATYVCPTVPVLGASGILS